MVGTEECRECGNFGEISPLKTDNSEFYEKLEILDDDQNDLVGVESKGPGYQTHIGKR